MKETKTLMERIANVDPRQLDGYMRQFDRMLLHTIAAATLPPEAIEATKRLWLKVAKKGIDQEANGRTEFLQGTREGRMQRMLRQPDGEDVRLALLETLDTAREIIDRNFAKALADQMAANPFEMAGGIEEDDEPADVIEEDEETDEIVDEDAPEVEEPESDDAEE